MPGIGPEHATKVHCCAYALHMLDTRKEKTGA